MKRTRATRRQVGYSGKGEEGRTAKEGADITSVFLVAGL